MSNNELVLRGYDNNGVYTTAGLNTSHSLVMTYGQYLVRFKMATAPGYSYALSLYPATGATSPDVVFASGNGTNTTTVAASYWKNSSGVGQSATQDLKLDTSTWHTVGVDWTPGLLSYTVDGVPWWSETGAAVPDVPLALCIQTEANPSQMNASTPAEADMDIAWAAAYTQAPPGTVATTAPATTTTLASGTTSSTAPGTVTTVGSVTTTPTTNASTTTTQPPDPNKAPVNTIQNPHREPPWLDPGPR